MTLRHVASSLITRLIAVGLILLIIGSLTSYFRITEFLREDLEQSVSARQLAMARYVASNVDSRLGERREILERLAAALPTPLLAVPDRLHEWLGEHHALQIAFVPGLLVAGADGRIIARVPADAGIALAPDAAGANASTATGVLITDAGFRAAAGGTTSISRPQPVPASKQWVLPIATPVRDSAGQVVAVLVGLADLATIAALDQMPHADRHDAADILLVSPQDRLIVASTDPAQVLAATPAPGVNVQHDAAMSGVRGVGHAVAPNGVDELSATASVDSAGWYVAVRMPASEAFGSVERTKAFLIRHTLTRSVLVLVLVGLLVAWLLRPLYRAAALAERMTQGELPLAPLPVAYPDEVGHLTASFNRLLQKLAGQQAELGRIAYHDALTGLPNRKLLIDRMLQAQARAARNHTRLAVLFLDLDGFKTINDSLGHEAGDEALRQIARRLSGLVRQADTLARLGGDEFVLLAPDMVGPVDASVRALAEKCIAAVARPIELQGVLHTLDVSIGIAVSGEHDDPDSLLAAADKAMYEAKRSGRGGYSMAGVAPSVAPGVCV